MPPRLPALLFASFAAALAAAAPACSGGGSGATATTGSGSGAGGGAGGGTAHFDSITIEPATATLSVTLGGTATRAYQAFGVSGATKKDVSATCSWSVPALFGSMNGATLTAA